MEHHDLDWDKGVSGRFAQHARFPENFGLVEGAQGTATGVGSCGDAVEIAVRLEKDTIAAIGHIPKGCVYTVACASAVCVLAHGKSVDEALALSADDVAGELGGLPEDHLHCARLAVNTLGEAIADAYKAVMRPGHSQE
jgi:nitrogen fixation NifU-like protein